MKNYSGIIRDYENEIEELNEEIRKLENKKEIFEIEKYPVANILKIIYEIEDLKEMIWEIRRNIEWEKDEELEYRNYKRF